MQDQSAVLTDATNNLPIFIRFGSSTVIRPARFEQRGLESVKPDLQQQGTHIAVDGQSYYVLESFKEVVAIASGGEIQGQELVSNWNNRYKRSA